MVDSSAIEGIETPSVNLEFFSWKRLNKKIVCDMLILHLVLRCSGIFYLLYNLLNNNHS